MKSIEQAFSDKLNHSIADFTRTKDSIADSTRAKEDKHVDSEEDQFLFPEDVSISNTFSALQEDLTDTRAGTSRSKPPLIVPDNDAVTATSSDDKIAKSNTSLPKENTTQADDIVLLIDSNEKYIDTTRIHPQQTNTKHILSHNRFSHKTLTETPIGRPSHIIIHVGTNDIERSPLDSCYTQFQTMMDIASQKYSSSKVLISSLLKRTDDIDNRRCELNSKLRFLCAPYPNVHLIHNDNIPEDYLHDSKHLKRRKKSVR